MIIDNPTIGDERGFVRIGEIKPKGTALKNMVEICLGHQYLVYVYYYNNASLEYNNSEHNNAGVAFQARMSIAFGKGIPTNNMIILQAAGVSEWYIESCRKIRYLYPKSQMVEYAAMLCRLAYYRMRFPSTFEDVSRQYEALFL